MKVENLVVKEREYNGNKFFQLFIVIDGKEYLMGTIRERNINGNEIRYINSVHKKYKSN